jgi:phosphatidylglycerophosphate synthase
VHPAGLIIDKPELCELRIGGLTLLERQQRLLTEVASPTLSIELSKLYHAADLKRGILEPWFIIASSSDIKRAEKLLYRSLIKPSDGPISKKLNRPLSLFVTSYLVQFGVRPSSMTTFCIVLTLIAAALALLPEWHWLAIAGLLFQLASALDGCDGEIARLTFTSSKFGAWYDTIGDNFRYGVFFCCLGFKSYMETHNPIYPYAIALFALVLLIFILTNSLYLIRTNSSGTFLNVAARVKNKTLLFLAPLTKLDVQAFVVMIFCFLGIIAPLFWISLFGIIAMTIVSIQSHRGRA